jgi:hypothetical protein
MGVQISNIVLLALGNTREGKPPEGVLFRHPGGMVFGLHPGGGFLAHTRGGGGFQYNRILAAHV